MTQAKDFGAFCEGLLLGRSDADKIRSLFDDCLRKSLGRLDERDIIECFNDKEPFYEEAASADSLAQKVAARLKESSRKEFSSMLFCVSADTQKEALSLAQKTGNALIPFFSQNARILFGALPLGPSLYRAFFC